MSGNIDFMGKEQSILPLFPLQGVVFFPGMNLPLHIFEEHYKEMIQACLKTNKQFGIVLAVNDSFAQIGTVAEILDIEKLDEGKMNIFTEGKYRFKVVNFISEEPYYVANIKPYNDDKEEIDSPLRKTIRQVRKLSTKALDIFDIVSEQELSKKLKLPNEPNELLFLVAANLTCSHEVKQSVLEAKTIKERANKILSLLEEEVQRLEILLENKKTKSTVIKNGKLKI